MHFDVEFHVTDQSFTPSFGAVQNISDGGFEKGYAKGHEDGTEEGYAKGHEEGIVEGYTNGHEVGTTEGYANGYATGVEEGYSNGREDGVEEGYTDGYTKGTAEGYTNGYETAKEEVLSDPQMVIDARATTVLKGDITTNVDKIVMYAFSRTSITSVTAPNVKSIGERSFESCTSLVSVDFPSVTSSGTYSLNSCTKLEYANFPLLKVVIGVMFYACSSLKRLDFPSVTSIDNSAFTNCTGLKQFILRADAVCTLKYAAAFNGSAIAKKTCLIFVPASRVESYKTATNWSTYATLFRAVEDITVDGTIMGELDEDKIAAAMATL
jgi:hypothetical protein